MQFKLLALFSLVTFVVSAGPLDLRDTPLGLIATSKGADCPQAGTVVGVKAIDGSRTLLPPHECKPLDMFLSFRGASPGPCPSGKTGKVTAYYFANCTGEGVSTDVTVVASDCREITLDLVSGIAGGHSADFLCV